MIVQVERQFLTEVQSFSSLKNFLYFKPYFSPKKNQRHAFCCCLNARTPSCFWRFCLKKCLDVCTIIYMCVEWIQSILGFVSFLAWPWQVRNSWRDWLWDFWLKDQCLNKIYVLITHLHIQLMCHCNSITS